MDFILKHMKKTVRKIILLLPVILAIAGTMSAKSLKVNYVISNPDTRPRMDEPVVIPVNGSWVKSATVYDGKHEIPSQLDDLNGDGRADELAFVITLAPRERKELVIVYSDRPAKPNRYPARVYARMSLKEGTKEEPRNVPVTRISAREDNMYNRLHHHGPAFESEKIAYRIYFDRKQTVDIYGKKREGLELAETLWYPTDEQLARGMGNDVIRVFGSVGVGALKGWDEISGQAVHIEPMEKREARIVAGGPIRTIVDMEVEGWFYRGRKIGMNSRYILYAGHRAVQVENRLYGDLRNLVFCTGVMKMKEEASYTDGRGVAAVWGTDFPVDDTVKYARETVGLAIAIAPEYVKEQRDDKLNRLYLLLPDANDEIKYSFTAAAEKESFGYKTAEEFFGYVREWAGEERKPARVAVGRIKRGYALDGVTRTEEFIGGSLPKKVDPAASNKP